MESPSSRTSMVQSLIGWVLVLSLISGAACQSSAWLNPHNTARAAVGVAGLQWDQSIADYATSWANSLVSERCGFRHRPNNPYGENLYKNSGPSTPGAAVSAWVNEKQYYNYGTNSCASGQVCGHYTQVVWRNSQFLGCGTARCPDGDTIWVCNYNPRGNIIGQKPY